MTAQLHRRDPAALLTFWLALCTWLVVGGWLLSAFHALDKVGYGVLLVGFLFFWRFALSRPDAPLIDFPRWRRSLRRFLSLRRILPMLFAVTALVILVRGVAIPPNHDDGLCYRIPRVLHWLDAGGWHWIDARDSRLNTRGTVAEWLFAPLLLFTRSDRLLFLPNWISHLFLPGLIYTTWRNLGVSRRIAWIWMWLLPSAFCFSLQAGNSSNDSLSAFFALAVFALLPARGPTPTFRAVSLAVLALALMSGTKPNLAPLALAFLVVFLPAWRVVVRRPVAVGAVGIAAALVSFAPNALFNYRHLHEFSGLSQESYIPHGGPPAELLAGNLALVSSQNLIPPLLTWLPAWTPTLRWWAETPFGHLLRRDFEHSPFVYYPVCSVEQAGIGFVVLLAGILIFLLTRRREPVPVGTVRPWRQWLAHGGVWLAVLVFLGTSTAIQGARLLCAYYPLLLAGIFAGRRLRPGRAFRAARLGAGLAMLAAAYCLTALTENPLVEIWPEFNGRRVADEARMAVLGRCLPSGEKDIGLIRAWNQRESWLWQPYGARRVDELPVDVPAQTLRERGIRYAVVSRRSLQEGGWHNLLPWLEAHGAALVACLDQPEGWYLVRFDP